MSHRWRAVLQVSGAVAVLVAVVALVGGEPFRAALGVLTPLTALAALALGGLATAAQALRWRVVVAARGAPPLGRGTAVGEYYRSALLNAVLPGGLAGDVLRAHRARGPGRGTGRGGWRTSAAAVLVERLAGTALLLGVGAVVLALVAGDQRGAGTGALWAAAPAVVALVLLVGVGRAVGAGARHQAAVWGWSLLALGALVGLFAVAAVQLARGPAPAGPDAVGTAVLAVLALLGMSVPLGVGGFGPREALAALGAGVAGTTPGEAVAVTAGYGVLAAVAALPGLLLLALDLVRAPAGRPRPGEDRRSGRDPLAGGLALGARGPQRREVELDGDVVTEQEAPRGGP
jgi:hypothetical protein